MFGWFKKEDKTNKEIAIEKFKKAGLTFEEADYLAQDVAELSLYADNNLFSNEEDNVHSIEEAYKDKYFMDTVDTIIRDNLPIKDIAYTGIQARAMGLTFEERMSLKNAVFNYLEKSNLDNSYYEEVFIRTLEARGSKEEPSALIQLLFTEGWIDDMDNKQYITIAQKMIDTMGEEQALNQFKIIFEECELWYYQVNNPVTPLQKSTSLILNWGIGKLAEVKHYILHGEMLPLDILVNTLNLKEQIKLAIESAIENEGLPEIEDEYKDEVAARFVQYMQEKVRQYSIDRKESSISYFKYRDESQTNSEVELTYISTVETIMGEEFKKVEDLENIPTKSVDFTRQILKINGQQVPHFKVHKNTARQREWLHGELGEIWSKLISVNLEEKKVEFTVIVPSAGGALFGDDSLVSKPSTQIFTYDHNVNLENIVVEA